jgi:hypothetical protein
MQVMAIHLKLFIRQKENINNKLNLIHKNGII